MKQCRKMLAGGLVLTMVISLLPVSQREVKAEKYKDFYYTISDEQVEIVEYAGNDTNVTIPSEIDGYKVTSIGTAFNNNASVITVSIPDSVTTIKGGAFSNCISLETFEMPDSVTKLGSNVFASCSNLRNIRLSNNLTVIEDYTFGQCSSLESIVIPDSVTTFGTSVFSECSNLKSVTLSSNLTSTMYATFYNCTSLKSITIPNSMTEIRGGTFMGCSNLESVDIPDSITSIENSVFEGCTSLNSIVIPDSVTSIGSASFKNCDSLTTFRVSKNLTSIDCEVWADCDLLTDFSVESGNRYYSAYDGNLYNYDQTVFIQYATGKKATMFTIPKGVKTVERYAFEGSKNLLEVKILNEAEEIGFGAFSFCPNLTKITIPASITAIGSSAISTTTTIYGYINSAAETYAKENGNEFVSIGVQYLWEDSEIVNSNAIRISLYERTAFLEGNVFDQTGEKNLKVNGAKAHYGSDNATELGENQIEINYDDIDSSIFFEKDDYRDYMIPLEVMESWKNNGKLTADAFIAKDNKDGRPYVSTVFARVSKEKDEDAYIEVQTGEIQIIQNLRYDVIVSAVGAKTGATYYISQDNAHKISSSTGNFSRLDLYSNLVKNYKTYVYIKNPDGTTSEPVEINLEKLELCPELQSLSDSGTFGLIGPDGSSISIGDNVPLIGGSNINFDAIKFPVGIDIEGNKVKLSFGVDVFEEGKLQRWEDFKESFNIITQMDESVEENVSALRRYDYIADKNNNVVKSQTDTEKNISMSVLGYAEAQLTGNGLVFTEVCGLAAAEFAYQYTQQTAIWVVPAYFYVEAGGRVSLDFDAAKLVADKEVPFDFNMNLKIEPELKLGGGAGIKGAVSGGIYGSGSLPFENNFAERYRKVTLNGEFGVEGEFFVLSGDKSLLSGSVNIYDGYYGMNKSVSKYAKIVKNTVAPIRAAENDDTKVLLLERDYLDSTSDWLGEEQTADKNSKQYSARVVNSNTTENTIKITDLQTSVYKNSQCQLVSFGDRMMMAWIEDTAERDSYNRLRLVYSVYDSDTRTWSVPKAVADNGHLDGAPSLASDGENVYIAWQNIDAAISSADETTVSEILSNSEIMFAKYDGETDCFADVKKLTDNQTYDYAPSVSVDNGKAVVYWVNSSDNAFSSGKQSIVRNIFGEENQTVYTELNYITECDSAGNQVSYMMDADGDIGTSNDICLYTNGKKVAAGSEDIQSGKSFAYGFLNEKDTLFFADNANLHYLENGEVKDVFETSRSIEGNLQVISTGEGTILIWSELTKEGAEFFTCEYADGLWSSPVRISNMKAKVSNLSAVYYDNAVRGIFNRTERLEKTDDAGNAYYENGNTDLCQLETKEFTELGLSVIYAEDSVFVAGEKAVFTVMAENNGTEPVQEVQFEISDTLGNIQLITKDINLPAGASDYVELSYMVPEDFEETKLSVCGTVVGASDIDESNNTVRRDIGCCDICIDSLRVEDIGDFYKVAGIVYNNNGAAAKDVTVDVHFGTEDSEDVAVKSIGIMEAKQKNKIELYLRKESVLIEDGAYMIYFNTRTSSRELQQNNNNNSIAITEYMFYENDAPMVTTSVEINGFQISTTVGGMRTVYSVEPEINGMEVVERGLVYGLGGYASEEDMYVGADSYYVMHSAATSNGLFGSKCGTSPTADSYAMTMMQNIGTASAAALSATYYVRAYAKLSDGSYVYSTVSSYSAYNVAKILYDNQMMNTLSGHEYLYDNILSIVDSEYPKVEYPASGTVVKP